MTSTPWKAMGIAALIATPAFAAGNPHDAQADMIPGCVRESMYSESQVDPPIQYFDAHVDNSCNPGAIVEGVAELWVNDQMVASSPLDDQGRARLQHIRGGSLVRKPACVIVRGTQFQPCDHHTNDTPGHLRHGHEFPIEETFCNVPADPR
jgi:hypothetical protein